MIGSVLGLEHKKERLKALDQIERAHEQDSDVWPENYCYSLEPAQGGPQVRGARTGQWFPLPQDLRLRSSRRLLPAGVCPKASKSIEGDHLWAVASQASSPQGGR